MHKTDAMTLIGYTFWADHKILAACEGLSPHDFTRTVTPDPGWHTLHGTLVHLLDTHYGWRVVLQELPDAGVLDEANFPDVNSLKARWQVEQVAWQTYVAGLSDDDVNAVWRANGATQVTRWHTILHVVNHGTLHRSEAAAMLTGYGRSPGELDFDSYLASLD